MGLVIRLGRCSGRVTDVIQIIRGGLIDFIDPITIK